jgi:hypothetical protein
MFAEPGDERKTLRSRRQILPGFDELFLLLGESARQPPRAKAELASADNERHTKPRSTRRACQPITEFHLGGPAIASTYPQHEWKTELHLAAAASVPFASPSPFNNENRHRSKGGDLIKPVKTESGSRKEAH